MTNADKFKGIFGIYATELWAKTEKDFLEWLNEDVPDTNDGDTISRQAAIDALCKMRCGCFRFSCPLTLEEDGTEECADVRMLMELPSAQRKGKIIIRSNMLDGEDCYCSKCDHYGLLPDYKYCPYCGVAFEGVITEGEEE